MIHTDPVDTDPAVDSGPGHTVTGPSAGPAAHAARPAPGLPRHAPAVLAVAAALAFVTGGVTAAMPADPGSPATGAMSRAARITATPAMPLTTAELAELTLRPLQAGPLSSPARLAACLVGLGRAGAAVLGATTAPVHGHPAVVLVLPGEQAGQLRAAAVRSDCDADRPGLIVEQVVARPRAAGNRPV